MIDIVIYTSKTDKTYARSADMIINALAEADIDFEEHPFESPEGREAALMCDPPCAAAPVLQIGDEYYGLDSNPDKFLIAARGLVRKYGKRED